MDKNIQYDSSLGGNQELLPRINLIGFTSARAKEIQAMKQSLNTTTGTKLAFQRLPKHMRRRVMSHNAKRLPRRLREIHLNQLKKSGMPPKQKRPSRKYRRRPRNLLDDYNRRQRNLTWLETHIWHAKRFHMIQKWGYKLAARPCDKAFRACYRGTSKHCLIQDLSYFNSIEVRGPTKILVNGFKTICDCKVDLSIGAKAYIRGNREGQVVLFHNKSGVRKAIGPVYFHWKPLIRSETAPIRILWIWVHAAYYLEVLNVLVDCFNLKTEKEIEIYKNETSKVELIELKGSLNRFRLTGPLSLALLNNILKTPDTKVNVNLSQNCNWFKNYIENIENLDIFTKQCEYWKIIGNQSTAEFSPHTILSLTVIDPRFSLPKTKTKAIIEGHPALAGCIEAPESAAFGPIWDADIRSNVKENKLSNAKLAEIRSGLLVPGSEIEQIGGILPLIIIQRPGNRNKFLGYSSGFDLIVPAGWGNSFWISLIMWGGRAGGLREFSSIRFENGQTPFLAPDTQAGMEEGQKVAEMHKLKFFNLPPNKRPNYVKFGITEPFSFDWKLLIHEWNSLPIDDFFVLRDKTILAKIQELLLKKVKPTEKLNLNYNINCIVPVQIKLELKGTLKQFARIYLAEPNDFKLNQEPTEPLKTDANQEVRKQLRHAHKNLLKQLRRRRVRAKQNEKGKTIDTEILQKYRKQMEKLWMPEQNRCIRTSCSRQIIGFVTSGDFSFTQAHSCGIGYIAMGSIKTFELKSQKNKVLIRNIASRQYRVAMLEVIV